MWTVQPETPQVVHQKKTLGADLRVVVSSPPFGAHGQENNAKCGEDKSDQGGGQNEVAPIVGREDSPAQVDAGLVGLVGLLRGVLQSDVALASAPSLQRDNFELNIRAVQDAVVVESLKHVACGHGRDKSH